MNEIKTASAVFSITRERRQSVVDSLIYGNVKSMEHYRELMGNLEALNHVDQELKDLLEKQEQDDE
jgi:phosphopentomutase